MSLSQSKLFSFSYQMQSIWAIRGKMFAIKERQRKKGKNNLADSFRLLSCKMVDGDIEVVDYHLVSGLQHVVQEQVVVEAQVQPLPHVDLIDEPLLSPCRPGVRPHDVRVLQIKEVQELLLVWRTKRMTMCILLTLFCLTRL